MRRVFPRVYARYHVILTRQFLNWEDERWKKQKGEKEERRQEIEEKEKES